MCENCKELFKFSDVLEKFSKRMLKRNKGTTSVVPITAVKKNTIVKSYIDIKYKYEREMKKNLIDLQSGKISQSKYLELQKSQIQKAFGEAYSLGKEFGLGSKSPVDDNERRFIIQQVTKEMQFMTNFASDVINGSGKMPYMRRMDMYVNSLDSMFGFGRLVYLPEEINIIWTLGQTDKHCLDCLSFAAKNPYTKRTLPGFPKSGNTKCLSQCLCSLTYIDNKKEISSNYDSFILDKKFARIGDRKIPSEYDYKHLMGIRDEYYYHRYMFELTKDKKYQVEYMDRLKEFNTYKNKNKIYFPIYFNIQQNMTELKSFSKNEKFEYLSNFSTLRKGNFVSFFQGNKQMYGKVVEMFGTQAQVKTLGGMDFMVSGSTHILFKEK